MTLTDNLPANARIAVLRARSLGEMLCAVPALRALRTALPDAEVTLIGQAWAGEFATRFAHYVDRWVEFPGYPGVGEGEFSPQQTLRFLSWAQEQRFDLALQLQDEGRQSNAFVEMIGAASTAGFYAPGAVRPDDETFLRYPEFGHESQRLLDLMRQLGAPEVDPQPEFPLLQDDWDEFDRQSRDQRLRAGEFVCLGLDVASRWTARGFAEVADALAAEGLRAVLTGDADAVGLASSVMARMTFPATNLVGQTSLGGLACLLTWSGLLVCEDGDVSQLGAALNTPSVIVFSDPDVERWAPQDRRLHRVVRLPEPETPRSVAEARIPHYEVCGVLEPEVAGSQPLEATAAVIVAARELLQGAAVART